MKARTILSLLLLFFILALPCVALADAPPDFGDDVDDVPIDGGLSLLVAAGVGYSIKRIKQQANNNEQ